MHATVGADTDAQRDIGGNEFDNYISGTIIQWGEYNWCCHCQTGPDETDNAKLIECCEPFCDAWGHLDCYNIKLNSKELADYHHICASCIIGGAPESSSDDIPLYESIRHMNTNQCKPESTNCETSDYETSDDDSPIISTRKPPPKHKSMKCEILT